MTGFPQVPENVVKAILECKRAVVCGHLNPDGDCSNSVLAMGRLLSFLGKEHILVNEGIFSRPELEEFSTHLEDEIPSSWLSRETLGIVVDCSTPDRLGHYSEPYSMMDVLVIDHHSSGEMFGNYRYVFPDSPSTTLLVYNVYKACGIEPDETACRFLYRGFATDSGFYKFLHANCGPVFDIVGDLVDHNVSPNEEFNSLTGNRDYDSVRFLSRLIDRNTSHFGGRVMTSFEAPSDVEEFSDNARPSDDYYAQMLSVRGVEVVVFFKQSRKEEGSIVLGLRASHFSGFDVGAFASSFGGGGHVKAAGATVKGSLEEVTKLVLERLGEYFAD